VSASRARRLGRDTILAAGGRIATIGLWIVLTPALLHTLGTERFGLWALFLAVAGYFGGLDLGLSQAVLRHVAAARAHGDMRSAAAHTWLGVTGYLILGAVWALSSWLLSPWIVGVLRIPPNHQLDAVRLVRASPFLFAAIGVANVSVASLQGHGRFDLGSIAVLTGVTIQGVGVIYAIHSGGAFIPLVSAVIAGWWIIAVMGFALLLRLAPGALDAPPREWRARLPESLRFGLPMQLAMASSTIHSQMDKFFLTRMVSLAAVTPFEIAFRVAGGAATVPQQFFLAVMPLMAELRARNQDHALARLYREGDRLVLAATSIWLAALGGGAGAALEAWLGAPPPLTPVLTLGLATAWAIALSTGMGTSLARGIGRTGLEARFAVIVLMVHLVGSLVLIPRLGALGAVIATVVANLVGACIFLAKVATTMQWSRMDLVIRGRPVPVLASIAGAAAGWWLSRQWPHAHGVMAWVRAIGVATVAALVAGLILLMSGYLRSIREQVGMLLRPGAAS
jgi:O-antigen/teichoic acid export membrane protein